MCHYGSIRCAPTGEIERESRGKRALRRHDPSENLARLLHDEWGAMTAGARALMVIPSPAYSLP